MGDLVFSLCFFYFYFYYSLFSTSPLKPKSGPRTNWVKDVLCLQGIMAKFQQDPWRGSGGRGILSRLGISAVADQDNWTYGARQPLVGPCPKFQVSTTLTTIESHFTLIETCKVRQIAGCYMLLHFLQSRVESLQIL